MFSIAFRYIDPEVAVPLIESHPWIAIPIFIGSQLSIVFGVPAAQFASCDFLA